MDQKNFPAPEEQISVNGVSFKHRDIFNVIDDFYHRIQKDPVLSVPFQSVHDWPEHIQRLTHFWWIKLGGKPYLITYYSPVTKHFFAGFNEELLKRWLGIFHDTLKNHLREDQFQIWSLISQRMGHALSIKNEMFRKEYEWRKKQEEKGSTEEE